MTESEIQRAILVYLGTRMDLLTGRTNTGAALSKSGLVRFGVKGMADIHCVQKPTGRLIAIEVKTATGRQSNDQKKYQRAITSYGGLYVLARSVADVEKALGTETRYE